MRLATQTILYLTTESFLILRGNSGSSCLYGWTSRTIQHVADVSPSKRNTNRSAAGSTVEIAEETNHALYAR